MQSSRRSSTAAAAAGGDGVEVYRAFDSCWFSAKAAENDAACSTVGSDRCPIVAVGTGAVGGRVCSGTSGPCCAATDTGAEAAVGGAGGISEMSSAKAVSSAAMAAIILDPGLGARASGKAPKPQ